MNTLFFLPCFSVTPIKYGSKTMEDDQLTLQATAAMDTGPTYLTFYMVYYSKAH
jgi:hypothetical protein